ncbi:hypothetical protein EWM64_g880 [Hericium alpestre]|uniref:RRM domain-containing protein n=1 Tax=Hericium alpestre TaxID=135208 RepID=A0A4Z0A7R5_9AGAM|nr:hypothetical protein EWM64_g880 [Hericium alpestre]
MAASPQRAERGDPQAHDKWANLDEQGGEIMGPPGDTAPSNGGPVSEDRERPGNDSGNPEYARSSGDGVSGKSGPPSYREKQVKPNKVYIGGLPETTRQEDLQSCFGKIGTITNIELKVGYGFVEFDSREAAEEGVAKYNEGWFMGNKIRVELSRGGGRYAKFSGDPGACFKCGQLGHWASVPITAYKVAILRLETRGTRMITPHLGGLCRRLGTIATTLRLPLVVVSRTITGCAEPLRRLLLVSMDTHGQAIILLKIRIILEATPLLLLLVTMIAMRGVLLLETSMGHTMPLLRGQGLLRLLHLLLPGVGMITIVLRLGIMLLLPLWLSTVADLQRRLRLPATLTILLAAVETRGAIEPPASQSICAAYDSYASGSGYVPPAKSSSRDYPPRSSGRDAEI